LLSDEERRRCAEDLLRAELEKKVVLQPSRTFPDMEIEDAYRIQDL
jgi:2-oxo-hept-3-ene-1,7-dioate hydratase